ncbi:hypothetical protein FHG87_015080, partial [Trinorchestia longiramus]
MELGGQPKNGPNSSLLLPYSGLMLRRCNFNTKVQPACVQSTACVCAEYSLRVCTVQFIGHRTTHKMKYPAVANRSLLKKSEDCNQLKLSVTGGEWKTRVPCWRSHVAANPHPHPVMEAVKFGRMSKKQREKVEDEVRYHKNQMRAASVSETSPDSSVYEPTSPSQDMFSAQYGFGSNELNFNNHYNFSPRPGGASGSSLDISSADSTTYDPHNRGCLDIQAQTSLDSGDSDTHSSSLLTACRNERQWKSSEAVPASWEYRKSVHGFRNLPLDIRSGGCSSNMEGAIKPDLMEGSGGGGSLSHDMDILIKQEVDGLDMNNLQSSHISGDSVEADMTSPDHMTSVDSTTFLPCPSVSPQPNSSQAALSLHPDRPHMGHFGPGDHGDFSDLHQQQQPHHHQQHQLTHREFHSFIPGQIPLTNQEQAIRTSAMLYDDILAGYETDEVSTVLARLLGSAMRESIESLVKKTSCVKGGEDQQPNYFAKM